MIRIRISSKFIINTFKNIRKNVLLKKLQFKNRKNGFKTSRNS